MEPLQCVTFGKDNRTLYTSTCPITERACFVIFNRPNPTALNVDQAYFAGCWAHSNECDNDTCVLSVRAAVHYFCCCKKSNCTSNIGAIRHKVTQSSTTTSSLITATTTDVPTRDIGTIILYFFVAFFIALFIICLCLLLYCMYRRQRYQREYQRSVSRNQNEMCDLLENTQQQNAPQQMSCQLNLISQIAQGRFGAVWLANLQDRKVAVKIFPMSESRSFECERDIYSLPCLKDCACILEYVDSYEAPELQQLWIYTVYQPLGSLFDYLTNNTLTYAQLICIAKDITEGLSFLHEPIMYADKQLYKPPVAHRDFKSKNVLLRSSHSACVADFGLAMKFDKPVGDYHHQVGTKRYMAPEVLERAVHFSRDAFLRIDVYALGLVLWELASRCLETPDAVNSPFKQPFEKELADLRLNPTHPSIEDMTSVVVRYKCRPHVHKTWQKHRGLQRLCSSMEECWDHDSEARLTVGCVLQRLSNAKTDLSPDVLEQINKQQNSNPLQSRSCPSQTIANGHTPVSEQASIPSVTIRDTTVAPYNFSQSVQERTSSRFNQINSGPTSTTTQPLQTHEANALPVNTAPPIQTLSSTTVNGPQLPSVLGAQFLPNTQQLPVEKQTNDLAVSSSSNTFQPTQQTLHAVN